MSGTKRAARILLVDDDPDFVEMNRAVLADGGYAVIPAYSGAQCLKLAASEKPDLIILDMVMEGRKAGLDVSRALRESDATRGIPIIMITSVHETVPVHVEPDPAWLPVDLFLEKPVDPALLLDTVAGILAADRPSATPRRTIMLVDDDHDFLAMNRSILESRGYRVLASSSPRDALQTARRERPNLIVTDLMMKDLDAGFSLARAVKEDPSTASTPVIIVTAASSQRGFDLRPRSVSELEAMRADAFLDKPVSPATLLAKVEELLK